MCVVYTKENTELGAKTPWFWEKQRSMTLFCPALDVHNVQRLRFVLTLNFLKRFEIFLKKIENYFPPLKKKWPEIFTPNFFAKLTHSDKQLYN